MHLISCWFLQLIIFIDLFVQFCQVTVPMKFSGSGHVELRPPQNLDDLKAYTSMILSLQRPKDRGDGKRRRRQAKENADMFVLYLGNRDVNAPACGYVFQMLACYFTKGANNLCPADNEKLLWHGLEEQRVVWRVQAQRAGV